MSGSGARAERPRVVVTGAGVVSPLGDRPGELFAALCRGESAIAPAQEVDLSAAMAGRAGSPIAGEVKGFDPRDYLGKKNFRPLDRTGRLATVAAELALADSGWDAEARSEHEVGLVLGTMFGSVRTIAEFDRRALTAGPNYAKPMDFANSVINAAAGQTAIWHDLRGINTTLSGGNTGGLGALGYAADLVAAGRAEAILAGGADELCFESFYGFQQAGLLAGSRNGGPPRPVPLDARRNGFVPGEGAALLVLERADAAAARGARVHAVVAGHGSAFDPSRGGDEVAAVAALAAAVRQALADAGVEPGAVDLLSLSANGSVDGDAREARALGEVFGDRLGEIPACAVKATLGEALGAAGGYQALAAVSALGEGRLPGVPTLEEAEGGVPLPSLDRGERTVEAKVALVTGLDFDGSAVAVVLTRPS